LARFQEARIRGFGNEAELQRVARFFAAVALNRLGKFEAAYQALKGFAYENRRTPHVLNAFGLCMLRLPYLPWEVPPDRKEVIQRVGEATFAWESGNRERSRELFAQLLAEYPTLPHLRYSWGLLLLSSAPNDALDLFLRELELTADHLPALVEVALEYIRRGDYGQAAPYAERVRQVEPGSFAGPFLVGQVLLETGSQLEALRLLEEAVQRAPARPETHFVLGRAYQRVGRREDAQRELREFERLRTLMKEAEEFLTERDYSVTRENNP
jgi:predicted Zn-dependent protease